jgi:hypothetical protein
MVTCTQCGAARDAQFVNGAVTAPCTNCGSMAVTVGLAVDMRAELGFTGTLEMEWKPAPSGLAWLDRWNYLRHERALVSGPIPGSPTIVDDIRRAYERLTDYIVKEFHLRDCLIDDGARTGIAQSQIDNALRASGTLTLLADVANTVKHIRLDRPPWSGEYPNIGQPSGSTSEGTWRLRLPITHKGKTWEGADLAYDALNEWWTVLTRLGLAAQHP